MVRCVDGETEEVSRNIKDKCDPTVASLRSITSPAWRESRNWWRDIVNELSCRSSLPITLLTWRTTTLPSAILKERATLKIRSYFISEDQRRFGDLRGAVTWWCRLEERNARENQRRRSHLQNGTQNVFARFALSELRDPKTRCFTWSDRIFNLPHVYKSHGTSDSGRRDGFLNVPATFLFFHSWHHVFSFALPEFEVRLGSILTFASAETRTRDKCPGTVSDLAEARKCHATLIHAFNSCYSVD